MSVRLKVIEAFIKQLDAHYPIIVTREEFEALEAELHPAERFMSTDSDRANLVFFICAPRALRIEVTWKHQSQLKLPIPTPHSV